MCELRPLESSRGSFEYILEYMSPFLLHTKWPLIVGRNIVIRINKPSVCLQLIQLIKSRKALRETT
jgi:hypothetical protein